MNDQVRIVILGRDDDTTPLVYNYLSEHFLVSAVVLEASVSGMTVLRRRAKRLGFLSALGQGLFVKLAVPILKRIAAKRVSEILVTEKLHTTAIPAESTARVDSINDEAVIDILAKQQPTHVIVNGTRLISKRILDQLTVPIINIHLGWNPRYRGGNGAYWALWNNDATHAGVTVHLIDPGIDTGDVLARSVINPTPADSFVTYPYLQLAVGLRALTEVIKTDTLSTAATTEEPSNVWYHPTIWGYLWNRFTRGVK